MSLDLNAEEEFLAKKTLNKEKGLKDILQDKKDSGLIIPDEVFETIDEFEAQRGFLTLDLLSLKKTLKDIQGEWNGDEPGELEDRAHIAREANELIDELIKKLELL
jgi:hypothetical protein